MIARIRCGVQGNVRTCRSGGEVCRSSTVAVRRHGDSIRFRLSRYQGKLPCREVPGAVLRTDIQGIAVLPFFQSSLDSKAAVPCGINAFVIFPAKDFAAGIRRAGDLITTCRPVRVENRGGKGQHRGGGVPAYQQEHAGHILALHAVYAEHQSACKIGDGKGVRPVRCEGHIGIHACDRNAVGFRAGHGKGVAAAAHIGMVHAVFVRRTGCAVHRKGKVQRRIFRQENAGGFGFCAVILCAVLCLRVGAYTDLVGLVCRQVFGFLCFLAAHGQRHVDGSGFIVKVVTKAGIDPATVLLLINRHAVAVGVIHLLPSGAHDLVAGSLQMNGRRRFRLFGVRIRDFAVELVAVDSSKRFFHLAVTIKICLLFCHQEGGYIVFARRCQCAAFRNVDSNIFGIRHYLLLDQIVRAALGIGKIRAQHILCTRFGVFDFARQLIIIQIQDKTFERGDGNAAGFVRHKRKRVCVDLVGAALRQPQHRYTIFLFVILVLEDVGVGVDDRVWIPLAAIVHPVDCNILVILFNC